jgi:hypothetical protein
VFRLTAGYKLFDEKGSETPDNLTVAERVEKENLQRTVSNAM